MSGKHKIQVTTSRNINRWTHFIDGNRVSLLDSSPDTLEVDFCAIEFIRPPQVASLACLIEEYYACGAKVVFKKNTSKPSKYLDKINFFQYWEPGFNRKEYHRANINTHLCLWQLDRNMISPYVDYSQKYYQNNYFAGQDLQGLNTSMAEVFNNIVDHAHSAVSGYSVTQYYPNRNEIVLSVCDFGNGIPYTVNAFLEKEGKKLLSDFDAIRRAFKKGFSTRSTPTNRGFGLNTISSLVKTLNGRLIIVSNQTIFEQQIGGDFVEHYSDKCFPGTLIAIYLDTRFLEPISDEELVENEFML